MGKFQLQHVKQILFEQAASMGMLNTGIKTLIKYLGECKTLDDWNKEVQTAEHLGLIRFYPSEKLRNRYTPAELKDIVLPVVKKSYSISGIWENPYIVSMGIESHLNKLSDLKSYLNKLDATTHDEKKAQAEKRYFAELADLYLILGKKFSTNEGAFVLEQRFQKFAEKEIENKEFE